ncbi:MULTISPECIES: FcoT family thioesterase [unclassified Streptomyces]|uniref:FcoT family thioesterase n=1 Tax=unclassified Streptomyces TaxID=2593676 RepID=UPI002DDA4A77|nr:FcoT family thioesterase [Streptomyces sp. NBC_01750]WSA99655.1 FcoT family thioesterase [Streptomyces sp. NBC_01794]WSD35896.1 FcoT family thioesterase [Streptomyces sp. NBC_01750]
MTELLQRPGERADSATATRYPTDEPLLQRVLTPYRAKRCEYLRTAEVICDGGPGEGSRLSAECTFEIPESCYIDDTGHFNSVEFNICYNQMAYYLIAKAVQDGLTEPFNQWSMNDFWHRQLGDILITDFSSSFRVPMRGRYFQGGMEILDIVAWDANDIRDALVVVKTFCRYYDEHGGDSKGYVTAAITNPPPLQD